MKIGGMYFRLYIPSEDVVVNNYVEEDWLRIFKNTTEEDIKDMSTCTNVVVLLWCDVDTDTPHGMLYFEEDFNQPTDVFFHGGTWDHNPKLFKKIFQSVVFVFDFILSFKFSIVTTCEIDNSRADRFQQSLCFEEIRRNDSTIYKVLNKEKYADSYFIKMMRTPK